MKSKNRFRFKLMVLAVVALCVQQSPTAAAQVPEENRKQLVEAAGTPFIAFRDKVLDEIKVSDEQKEKLLEHVMAQIMETGPFLESLAESGEEREKKLNEHRKQVQEKLAKFLKEVLKPEQLKRLRGITLQQEGGLALGQEDVQRELKITQEQQKKFMAITQELQGKIESLIKEAQSGGKPEELRPNMHKIREEYGKKLEAVLTDEQTKKWKDMLGKPFNLRGMTRMLTGRKAHFHLRGDRFLLRSGRACDHTEQLVRAALARDESMEPKLVALKLFLDELDIPASIETIDDRKKVQKAVYLGQLPGVDLGYRFGWYLKGPYSPSLTKDYFSLAEALTSGDQATIGKQFSDSVRARLRSVLPLMQVPQETGLPLEDWLELVSSLHFLRKVQALDENKAVEMLERSKPHLALLAPLARDHLSKVNLLP